MAKNHESVLWIATFGVGERKHKGSMIFRTRKAAREFMANKFGIITRAVWGPDNIKTTVRERVS